VAQHQKMPRFHRRPQQDGAALITAILVVALAASAAMLLLGRIDHWIERVALTRDKAQALELARAGIDYARVALATDARLSRVDTLDEDWAKVLPPVRGDDSEVTGYIEDLQGRFNLNTLRRNDGAIDPQALAAYQRLLGLLGLPEGLADSLADWLDADDSTRAAGAESAYYNALNPPLRCANQPLEHFSNLLRIKGYSPRLMARLEPFAAVLPERQAVNLNTAPAEVLAAIQPGLGLAAAAALLRTRQGIYFRDLSDFQNRLPDKNLPPLLVAAGTSSRYFMIHMQVQTGNSRSRVRALTHRAADGGRPRILWLATQ
jgi:general secretion pathway protein K